VLRISVPKTKEKVYNKIIHQQCPLCAAEGHDNGHDNLGIYPDGHAYCFARHGLVSLESGSLVDEQIVENGAYTYQYLASRGISRETMAYYGVETKVNSSGVPVAIGFPYGTYSVVRNLPDKAYKTVGDGSTPSLFGKDKFNGGSSRSITVTEGAYDAMSIYECLGRKYAAVSVRSAATARQDCVRDHKYLDSFENIYICFDNDGPGQDAARDVAQLFDVNKVFHVKLDKWKDANEALQDSPEELRRVWWSAKKYQPKGVVSTYAEIEEILAKEDNQAISSYPFPTLDNMAYGIRSGELVLFTALEKVGKTEVLRSVEYHLLKNTEENIGIIHLEETEKRSVQGLVGYELGVPAHLPDSGVSLADQAAAYRRLSKKDGRLHFYSHFGSDDPDDIIGLVRYLAAVAKCKFIFLDHLTMLVTGMEGDDERRKLDYISTKLARLTRELNFTLFLVSHVNDEGQTRGSRMPSKLCDLEVYLSRDKESADAGVRNQTRLMVRNNRFGGLTGPAGTLTFDPKSFRLEEKVNVGEDSISS
jgi:twinkle protein